MNFLEIQDEVKDLLNFTSGTADQDFTDLQIRRSINRRYAREVAVAQQHGGMTWFHKVQEFTWETSDVTLTLPSELDGANIIMFEDVTDSDPGDGLPSGVFWKDNRTLQWGDAGPTSDRTLRLTYMARPLEMASDNDAPELIPAHLRMLLVWSAAIYLKWKAEETAPNDWKSELEEHRLDYWKYISRGRPFLGQGARVNKWPDLSIVGAQADQDGSSISQDNDD